MGKTFTRSIRLWRSRLWAVMEEHNPENCDECIIARENGDMDRQGY